MHSIGRIVPAIAAILALAGCGYNHNIIPGADGQPSSGIQPDYNTEGEKGLYNGAGAHGGN